MGSTVDHGSSFDDGLFNQCKFLFSGGEGGETEVKYFLEVANASVNEFSWFGTCSWSEVVFLDHESA